MNLSLLIKLVKLANNNPNENEANFAARKVCKMIADGGYKFSEPVAKMDTPPGVRPTSPPSQGFDESIEEIFRNIRWKGFDQAQKGSWVDPPRDKTKSEPDFKPYNPPRGYPINEYDMYGKRKEKPKRNLMCSVCKQPKNTIFQGLESMFTCNTCTWEAYARGDKK